MSSDGELSSGSGELTRQRGIAAAGELNCPTCDASFQREISACPEDGTKLIRLREEGNGVQNRRAAQRRVACGASRLPSMKPRRRPYSCVILRTVVLILAMIGYITNLRGGRSDGQVVGA